MKFNCGPTRQEIIDARCERLEKWHRYFAWYPVRVGPSDCRWLETVERRAEVGRLFGRIVDEEFRALK